MILVSLAVIFLISLYAYPEIITAFHLNWKHHGFIHIWDMIVVADFTWSYSLIQKWCIDMKNHLICSAIAYVLQLYISIIYNLCIEPIPFIYLYCFYFPPSNKQLLECIVLNKSLFISFFINVNSCFWDFFKMVFYILYALLQHMFCSSAFQLFTTCVSNQYHLFTCILYIFPF